MRGVFVTNVADVDKGQWHVTLVWSFKMDDPKYLQWNVAPCMIPLNNLHYLCCPAPPIWQCKYVQTTTKNCANAAQSPCGKLKQLGQVEE